MNFKYIYIILLLFIGSSLSFGQNMAVDSVDRHTEFGMNMTPLVAQFIPFKLSSSRVGPYNFIYKSYRKTTAFRMGLGLNLTELQANGRKFVHINTRVGVEKRKRIYKNWYYTGGIDGIGFVGGFNLPGDVISTGGIFGSSNPDIGAGLGLTMGVEYYLNPRISLSTESMFFLGLRSTTGIGYDIVPPIGLFLNVKLYK